VSDARAGRLVIVGAGGHAKVVVELFRAMGGFEILGLTDADPQARSVMGVPVLGGDEQLPALRREGVGLAFPAIGDNHLRARIGAQLKALGFALPNAISPGATISPSAVLGEGVAVMAGVVINAESRIGDFAIVNSGAVVDHDGRIGAAAHVGPGCALAGCVTLGERSLLGAGVSIIPGVSIGADAVVGAGAAVTCDLADRVVAVGVPARVIRTEAG
jgi:UDP-perosamine 4-acetyltransferase